MIKNVCKQLLRFLRKIFPSIYWTLWRVYFLIKSKSNYYDIGNNRIKYFFSVSGAGRGIGEFIILQKYILEQFPCKRKERQSRRVINYYPAIQFCPTSLPSDSIVVVHDLIPLLKGFEDSRSEARMLRKKYYKICQSAKVICTPTEFVKRQIISEFQVPREKIKVIGIPFRKYLDSLHRYSFDKAILRAKDYIIIVGSIEKHKNFEIIFRAMKDPRLRELSLIVVGNTKGGKYPTAHGRIRYTGFVKNEEKINLIKGARALLFPSITEGFGIPPVEAACLGIQCLVSNMPPMNEFWSSSEVILVNPLSEEDWIQAILKAWRRPNREMVKKAYAKVRAYSLCAEKDLINLFQTTLN